jgi:probable rRNA maturation factor
MVVIQNTLNDSSLNERNLTDTLQQVIAELGYGGSELLIRLVDTAEIQLHLWVEFAIRVFYSQPR